MSASSFRTPSAALAVSLLVAACADDGSTPLAPDARDGEGVTPSVLLGAPGHEELVRDVPGYGGMFLDEEGRPTVYLTDPEVYLDAELEVAAFMRRRGEAPSPIRVRQANFSLPRLDGWLRAAAEEVMPAGGVVSLDIDERVNRVSIGVEDAGMVQDVRRRALDLGIPDQALDVVAMGPFEPAVSLRDFVRPANGGLQINFGLFVCTLGFNVSHVDERPEPSFVTNSHCTDQQGVVANTEYFQPAFFVENSFLGIEVDDPPYDPIDCFDGFVCRLSDAARVRYDGGVPHTVGKIYRTTGPNNLDLTIDGEWTLVAKRRRPIVGQIVSKVGRSTGWTQGDIFATDVITLQAGSNIVLFGQALANAGVGPGDSGSPVLRTDGDKAALEGLLWGSGAGGTILVFSPIANIQQELGRLEVR